MKRNILLTKQKLKMKASVLRATLSTKQCLIILTFLFTDEWHIPVAVGAWELPY